MTRDIWFTKVSRYGLTAIYDGWLENCTIRFPFNSANNGPYLAAIDAGMLKEVKHDDGSSYLVPTWEQS